MGLRPHQKNTMKATVTNAKLLGAQKGGWGSFKHRLMAQLGIPQNQFDKWDVPTDWQQVFCKANGRELFNKATP
jgi:hypothetical protein